MDANDAYLFALLWELNEEKKKKHQVLSTKMLVH